MAKTIGLPNGRSWKSQTAALTHFKDMLGRYSDNQIVEDRSDRVPCDLSEELISFSEAHLDHAYPTFGQLVVSFRAARGWHHGVPVGVLTPPADAQTTTSFLDPSAAEAFRQFHRGAATLRIISRVRNLSMSAGQRRPRIKRPVQLIP